MFRDFIMRILDFLQCNKYVKIIIKTDFEKV